MFFNSKVRTQDDTHPTLKAYGNNSSSCGIIQKGKEHIRVHAHFLFSFFLLFFCLMSCLHSSVFQGADATNCSQAPLPWDLTCVLVPTCRVFILADGVGEALSYIIRRHRNMSNKMITKRGSPISSTFLESMVSHGHHPDIPYNSCTFPGLCGVVDLHLDFDHSNQPSNQRCWRIQLFPSPFHLLMTTLTSNLTNLEFQLFHSN